MGSVVWVLHDWPVETRNLPRRVDAVLFDLIGTLVAVDPCRLPVLRVHRREVPSALPVVLTTLRAAVPALREEAVLSVMAGAGHELPPRPELEAGIADPAGFAAVLARLGVRDDRDVLARRLAEVQMTAVVAACRPLPGARLLLARLRAHRIRTAVLSDPGHEAWLGPLLTATDPLHHFDAIVTSDEAVRDEMGQGPPAARRFRAALNLLGVEPRHAVHVGDDPEGDVILARQVGVQPVWLNVAGRSWSGPGRAPATIRDLTALVEVLDPPGSSAAESSAAPSQSTSTR